MAARRKRRVDKAKEQFWRGHLASQAAGRLSIRRYCAEHGLSEPSFYGWRREIVRRDRVAMRDKDRRLSTRSRGKPDFVRLEVQSSADVTPPIEIVLPDGWRVLIPAAGSDKLAEVLAALRTSRSEESRPC